MYDELVKRLRTCPDYNEGCVKCLHKHDLGCRTTTMHEAADAIEELMRRCEQFQYMPLPAWIPVTERLPENNVHVLLSCKCRAGAYVCDGFYTEKYSTPTQYYEDIVADYDEDTDEYYLPEGWWEVIKNWDDYSFVAIEDKVTHWMPLPEPS